MQHQPVSRRAQTALFRASVLSWILVAGAAAQSGTYFVETVAGAPRLLGDNGPGTSALLWSPQGVSVDNSGTLYLADSGDGRIRKLTPSGTITTIAGSTVGFGGDNGPAGSAQLAYPSKAVLGPNGDLLIVDTSNQRVRRVSTTGTITTIAGTGTPGAAGDGDLAANAQLNDPRDIAVDRTGAILVLDSNNARLRRFTVGGKISTVAGSGVLGYFGDQGPAVQAQLASPKAFALDAAGNIYIADTGNNRIRKVTTDGSIYTVAGVGSPGFTGDGGSASLASVRAPAGVAADGLGNVFIADTGNHRIRKIASNGVISTIAGGASAGFAGDNGPASAALLNGPTSISVDLSGAVYFADSGNHRIRRISPQGVIATVAGSDPAAGDGGPSAKALLFQPSGVAFDSSGNLYIADTSNHRVRRVATDGTITTAAGNGVAGYSGDNAYANRAQLSSPDGLAFDSAGNLYIADSGNHVVRRITAGIISTYAGSGTPGNTGDGGMATLATFYQPNAVAVDRAGNVYIVDSGNNRIRVVDRAGNIGPFAGDANGTPGYAGDNQPARYARFDYPRGIAIDASNNVYIADYFNNRIRRVEAGTLNITTYAGTGASGFSGDGGPASQARLFLPAGLAFDASNNLFVADLLNDRIRAIAPNGYIRTIAGAGDLGDPGEGVSALGAMLNSPRAVAADVQGNVYFSDQDANRVRRLTAQSISIRTIQNAASQVAGPIAPGEAVSIFGSRLGPVTGVSGTVINGVIGSALSGTRVLFDGVAAPLLYAGLSQINAIVPYSVAGKSIVRVQVEVQGLIGDSFDIAVRDAAPGLFTADQSGVGQAAAVNQAGSINSAAAPAPVGSIVSLYLTGEGQTIPSGASGQLIGSTVLPKPVLPVSVSIQGIAAEILYAGAAPQAAGLMQINVRIPSGVTASDRAPVSVVIGSFPAQPAVTLAVR
ncbi:MAG: SMP-30/gluconolactonase/LRE family protein [Acidobacteria bacterium]|nr:SMP-30/gluconolactonase/LRE family protein [Acidobacteriota bacterium]